MPSRGRYTTARVTRYGIAVLDTPLGTWWWEPLLQSLDYVPTGKRVPTISRTVPGKSYTLERALKEALVQMTDRWEEFYGWAADPCGKGAAEYARRRWPGRSIRY